MKRFAITGWCQMRIRQMLAEEPETGKDAKESCDFSRQFIDATAGTGKDTLFLCDLLGESGGDILSMDIQEMALEKTKARLMKSGYEECPAERPLMKGYEAGLAERPLMKGYEAGPVDRPAAVGDDDDKKNPDEDAAGGSMGREEWAFLTDVSGRKQVRLVLGSHEHMDAYFPAGSVNLIMFNLGYLPGGDHALATKPATTLPALEKALALLKTGGLLSLMIYSGGDSGFEEKEQVLAWLKGLDPERYMVLIESFYNRPNNPPLPVFIKKML